MAEARCLGSRGLCVVYAGGVRRCACELSARALLGADDAPWVAAAGGADHPADGDQPGGDAEAEAEGVE